MASAATHLPSSDEGVDDSTSGFEDGQPLGAPEPDADAGPPPPVSGGGYDPVEPVLRTLSAPAHADEEPDDAPDPPAAKKGGGCSCGGGRYCRCGWGRSGGSLSAAVLLALVVVLMVIVIAFGGVRLGRDDSAAPPSCGWKGASRSVPAQTVKSGA